jgi:hypothetical protein
MARFNRFLTGATGFLTFLLIPGCVPGAETGLVRAGTNQ